MTLLGGGDRPDALAVEPENVPVDLRALDQWVVWNWEPKWDRPGEWTKVPLMSNADRRASSTDPSTWGSFADALTRADHDRLPGIGFMFSADDPYTGIDLDKCRDQETGEVADWARAIVTELSSYTELSPSGTGVHIFVRGHLPTGDGTKHRSGLVEMYDRARYFTLTGHHCPGTPATVADRQAELSAFYTRTFGTNGHHAPPRATTGTSVLSDDDVISHCRSASNASKFLRLFAGGTSEYGGDDSAADLALLSMLSFWTPDPAQLDRLFRRSGLMRDKWERADYRDRTIAKALDRAEVWTPGPVPLDPSHHGDGARTDGEPAIVFPTTKRATIPWPVLDPAALTGLAGDVVRAIDPHSEGDPAATLVNYLTMFGSAVGPTPHALVGDRQHRANEFAVLVGDTSKGRKGTSHDTPEAIVRWADDGWGLRVQGGLASGEGVIWAVRDPIAEERKGEFTVVDPGEPDKRLLLVEEEYSAVLKVAGREGNTLSEIIRRGWDGKPLQILTKNKKARCESPHISILAHVTKTELGRELTDTTAANGFANRFLWVCVKRSKLLPEGGAMPAEERHELVSRTQRALLTARKLGTVQRDEQARGLWAELYGDLSEPGTGLWGALTDRAEAHVLRLSLLYALLDGSRLITGAHLLAALALWEYCAASARYIFGDKTGDPIADRVLDVLRAHGGPMSQSEIVDLFGRNVNQARLGKALETLLVGKLARHFQEAHVDAAGRKLAGRPRTVWIAT